MLYYWLELSIVIHKSFLLCCSNSYLPFPSLRNLVGPQPYMINNMYVIVKNEEKNHNQIALANSFDIYRVMFYLIGGKKN